MAALWPSLMWPPVLEAFYHAKTGVQKDFTMKLCLGEIMGGKAHKMIIQYLFKNLKAKGCTVPFIFLIKLHLSYRPNSCTDWTHC